MTVFLPFAHGDDSFSAAVKERTEKKRRGKSVVIGIVLLATLGAGLTWLRYTAQAPSTINAQLISDRLVLATFRPKAAGKIREGSKAIVTFESSGGKRFEGAVQSLETEALETRVLIVLRETPIEARPHSRCSVTVDTSVPSEVKSD
jgi:multidrug resistance efflux pump